MFIDVLVECILLRNVLLLLHASINTIPIKSIIDQTKKTHSEGPTSGAKPSQARPSKRIDVRWDRKHLDCIEMLHWTLCRPTHVLIRYDGICMETRSKTIAMQTTNTSCIHKWAKERKKKDPEEWATVTCICVRAVFFFFLPAFAGI